MYIKRFLRVTFIILSSAVTGWIESSKSFSHKAYGKQDASKAMR